METQCRKLMHSLRCAQVFSFEPSSGVIRGNRDRPTIASTQIVTVRFNPKKNVKYSTKFKVDIECGRGGFVVLEGSGSYDENMEPGTSPLLPPYAYGTGTNAVNGTVAASLRVRYRY